MPITDENSSASIVPSLGSKLAKPRSKRKTATLPTDEQRNQNAQTIGGELESIVTQFADAAEATSEAAADELVAIADSIVPNALHKFNQRMGGRGDRSTHFSGYVSGYFAAITRSEDAPE